MVDAAGSLCVYLFFLVRVNPSFVSPRQTLVTPPRCVSALLRVPFSLRYIVVVLHSQHTHTSALLRIPFVTIAGSFSSSFQTLVTTPRCVSALLRVPLCCVSAGLAHSLALSLDGSVFSWGCGREGLLGHGDEASTGKPRQVQKQTLGSASCACVLVWLEYCKWQFLLRVCSCALCTCLYRYTLHLYNYTCTYTIREGLLGHGDEASIGKPRQVNYTYPYRYVLYLYNYTYVGLLGRGDEASTGKPRQVRWTLQAVTDAHGVDAHGISANSAQPHGRG